ncbi:MAG: ATP-binding protein [Ilumatobacter sp.]|uniref:nSTAND1 domain-containing NTPase n=1 Tax=Ilumatobacter sp. TaxID=1967498 RepID=UPI002627FD5E|nr:ATP-binding protein [Ilumatobacter sp.]MDJ0771129.1 ATP-binding protein [Ilumatobacter sp.]
MPKRVTIFISSPGDVIPERIRLDEAIDRLRTEFASHLELRTVRWEELPLSATGHFQTQIPRPSTTDIVIVVFWWRLGTPLRGRANWPHEWDGPLSGGEVTGTEWEFEEAIRGATEQDGTPVVLVYQKLGIPSFSSDEQIASYPSEKARVDGFIARWFKDPVTETYVNAWRDFSDEAQFSDMVDEHVRALLRRQIEVHGPDVAWAESPFRGLASYDVRDAPIFFGRTRAQQRLRALAEQREEAESPWVLVTGATGSGKSSLIRAGLLPDVLKPGMVTGGRQRDGRPVAVGLARYVVVRPSDRGGDPLAALASGLLDESGLPELAAPPLLYDDAQLARLLAEGSDAARHPIKQGLSAAADDLSDHYRPLLVVVVDQLEETFRLAEERQDELLAALDTLAGADDVWIVASIRSDFLAQLDRHPLAERFGPEGRFLLGPPTGRELGQIITRPAAVAGLSWGHDDQGRSLDEELQNAAARDPAALPLLGYVLEQLWHRRGATGELTFDAYRALGGLEGAIGARAEEVFTTVQEQAQAALPRVLGQLVSVGQGDEARPVSQPAPLGRFEPGSAERELVDALLAPEARLLVADGHTVRVAHEAVLTHWRRAAAQLETDKRDLQLIARLRDQARRWLAVGDDAARASLLVSPGLPLTEAQDLLARRDQELDDDVTALIEQSSAAAALASEAELAAERARREEAEWRQLNAEKLERRAAAEEYFARGLEAHARADVVEDEAWRPNAADYARLLRERAGDLAGAGAEALAEAYELHQRLADHPRRAAEPSDDDAGLVFSLEALPARNGSCFLVHYGDAAAPRLAIVDGGDRPTWARVLRPALDELRDRRRADSLGIELVAVTQYDIQSIGGIASMFNDLADDRSEAERVDIERLWFNNFQGIVPSEPAHPGRKSFKWTVREAAEELGIPVNEPFDQFVMPAEIGPAQFELPGGLEITVIAPPNERVVDWYRRWIREQEEAGVIMDSESVAHLERAVHEFASSSDVTLVRRPPGTYSPSSTGRRSDQSVVNLSSLVMVLSFAGRTMLLTSDSRHDFIMSGLFDAWLLDPDHGVDVDVMVVPHGGSTRNVTAEFLEQVRAADYVVIPERRFHLPDPMTIDMLSATRGDAATLHVGGHLRDEQRAELEAMVAHAGLRSVFPQHSEASVVVDLLQPVPPALP